MTFDKTSYGPVLATLLEVDRERAIDEGTPNESVREQLVTLTIKSAFAHTRVVDEDSARCCLSAIWILHDFLDESHTISQSVDTAEGSYWHGIMHRREGDFSNAKYWFRSTGEHVIHEQLDDDWDPARFVDDCQMALREDASELGSCRELQRREWELLFDHCYRQAIGA